MSQPDAFWPHTVGSHSRTLCQTCKLPHLLNHRCLCHYSGLFLWSWSWAGTGLVHLWGAAQRFVRDFLLLWKSDLCFRKWGKLVVKILVSVKAREHPRSIISHPLGPHRGTPTLCLFFPWSFSPSFSVWIRVSNNFTTWSSENLFHLLRNSLTWLEPRKKKKAFCVRAGRSEKPGKCLASFLRVWDSESRE